MRRFAVAGVLSLVASGVAAVGFDAVGSRAGPDTAHAATADDPYVLTWSPPELTDPLTYVVGDDPYISLLDGRDYVVEFPDTPVRHRITIDGGRNVVVIGGEIDIPWQGEDPEIYERRGLLLRDQTGIVHIEGLLITGEDLSEGINIDAPDAIVQLQNIRVEHIHARDQVDFSDNHPDIIQAWGGVGELRVDRLTGQTDYQGIFLKEDFGPIGPSTLRRVHIEADPTGRYLLWNDDNFDITIDRVHVTPAPGRSLDRTLWPNAAAWPGINVGAPAGGEFVPEGLAGIGYEAWPYADDPTTPNTAPSVTAFGPSSTEAGTPVVVSGTVEDDGLPGPYSVRWSQRSGPAPASFANDTAEDTGVTFPAAGVYELELTADDGELTGSASLEVTVEEATTNTAPSVTVSASPGSIALGEAVALDGSVADDGLPGAYSVAWSQDSGPGVASFADAGAEDTTVSFSAAGTYVLSLTADDGELTGSASATVTVHEPDPPPPTNEPPVVIASGPGVVTLGDAAVLDGTVIDEGVPDTAWSQSSGPGVATFADATAEDTTVTFSAAGVYVLTLTADDGELTGSASVTITVQLPDDPTPVTRTFDGSTNKKWPTRTFVTTVGDGEATATLTFGGRGNKKRSADAEMTLVVYDAAGAVVGSASGPTGLSLTVTLAAGTYTWEVTGSRTSFSLEVVHMS